MEMENITNQYRQLEIRRNLMMESFIELVELLPNQDGMFRILRKAPLIIVWALVFLSVLYFCGFFVTKKRKPCTSIFFAAFHEKIRKSFQCQREETFKTIFLGTIRVLRSNREQPTVFLMMVPLGAMPAALRLVTLMIHCTLLACSFPASQRHVAALLIDGFEYNPNGEEWIFFDRLKKQSSSFGISAVLRFEILHPQLVKIITLLVSMTFEPHPESIIILVMDVGTHFTEYEKATLKPNDLGRRILQQNLGTFLDENELLQTIHAIGNRCVLINPEADQT